MKRFLMIVRSRFGFTLKVSDAKARGNTPGSITDFLQEPSLLRAVSGDAAAFVGPDLILVDDPVERGVIAQPILKHFGRNSIQS